MSHTGEFLVVTEKNLIRNQRPCKACRNSRIPCYGIFRLLDENPGILFMLIFFKRKKRGITCWRWGGRII